MKIFNDVKYNEETKEISFKDDGKEIIRKVTQKGNLKIIRYKNVKWFHFSYFAMGYGSYSNLYEITPLLEEYQDEIENGYEYYGWNGLHKLLSVIESDYQHLTTNESSSPSAPNSSIFRAIHHGFIKFSDRGERIGTSQYSCGSYVHYSMKIGSNCKNTEELRGLLLFVLSYYTKYLTLSNSDGKTTSTSIVYQRGTAHDVIGIG